MAEPLKPRNGVFAVAAACGVALTLVGCDIMAPPPPATLPSPVHAEAPVRLPPPPPRKPAPPPTSLARLPPPEPTAPKHTVLDRLIGLDQTQLAELLGEPRQKAEAPPATIWRYVASACDLDVYFYLDLQSQAMRALHYEVRSHDPAEQSVQRCYDQLLSERHTNADIGAGSDRPR